MGKPTQYICGLVIEFPFLCLGHMPKKGERTHAKIDKKFEEICMPPTAGACEEIPKVASNCHELDGALLDAAENIRTRKVAWFLDLLFHYFGGCIGWSSKSSNSSKGSGTTRLTLKISQVACPIATRASILGTLFIRWIGNQSYQEGLQWTDLVLVWLLLHHIFLGGEKSSQLNHNPLRRMQFIFGFSITDQPTLYTHFGAYMCRQEQKINPNSPAFGN